MHQLHYRFVAEGHCSSIGKVFQLLDDMPSEWRHVLLESLYFDFDVFSELLTRQEQQQAQYTDWKAKVRHLVRTIPSRELIEYGLIAYILGKANGRITGSLASLIDRCRDPRSDPAHAAEALVILHEKHATLRNAYVTFCEMVVRPLVEGDNPIDFGSEWLIDDSEPVAPEIVKQRLAERAGKPDTTGRAPGKPLPPDPWEPQIAAFLDQVAEHFDVSIRPSPIHLDVRVVNTAVSISVSPHSAPSEHDPAEPPTLRIRLDGLSPRDRNFRELGLPVNPKYFFGHRGLEFTVLPDELASLSDWVAQWIRGQESQSRIPPHA